MFIIYKLLCILLPAMVLLSFINETEGSVFSIREANVYEIRKAFTEKKLTSRQLVDFYLAEIRKLNPALKSVIEVNPNAVDLADKADRERRDKRRGSLPMLHGIPILVKDNIATADEMNTTAGSYALLRSVVPRDAGVVERLRRAGAIVLGKASMTEWAAFRSPNVPNGWNARRGQSVNPYVKSAHSCGSSTGSAISVATNMVAVSLGTETAGSILCPANSNSVVGIKPTVGLTSRAGVVPISPRQDTVGPICRTVADAVLVLDSIVGYDLNDDVETREASKYIPRGGYLQFLKADRLRGKRLGITGYPVFGFTNDTANLEVFLRHLHTLRIKGAILVEVLKIEGYEEIMASIFTDQFRVMYAEFKLAINDYLKQLVSSSVHSLAEVIAFNNKYSKLEKIKEYGQDTFLLAQETEGIGQLEKRELLNLTRASKFGFKKLMKENKLDALVTPHDDFAIVLAIGGYPGINVPAGYAKDGTPFGITFGGLKGSEPKLIEISYGFEQATKIRKPPPFHNERALFY